MKVDYQAAAATWTLPHNFLKSKYALMKQFESVEDIPSPLEAQPSKLTSDQSVQIQIPINPTTPLANWTSANTVRKTYLLLNTEAPPEDYCKTMGNAENVCTKQGNERQTDTAYDQHPKADDDSRLCRKV